MSYQLQHRDTLEILPEVYATREEAVASNCSRGYDCYVIGEQASAGRLEQAVRGPWNNCD